MGVGLREFAAGLTCAIREKARRAGQGEAAQLQGEADQIYILSTFLREEHSRAAAEPARQAAIASFYGLVLMCAGLLNTALPGENAVDLETGVRDSCEALVRLLRQFEHEYEAVPAGSAAIVRTRVAWDAVASLIGESSAVTKHRDLEPKSAPV